MTTNDQFESRATNPTRPEYYRVRGSLETEARMRADFTTGYRHWLAARDTFDSERKVLLNKVADLARKWTGPGKTGDWERLDHALAGWERYPRHMQEQMDVIAASPTLTSREQPIDQRTQQHARELAGRGDWVRIVSPEQARDQRDAAQTDHDREASARSRTPIERSR